MHRPANTKHDDDGDAVNMGTRDKLAKPAQGVCDKADKTVVGGAAVVMFARKFYHRRQYKYCEKEKSQNESYGSFDCGKRHIHTSLYKFREYYITVRGKSQLFCA